MQAARGFQAQQPAANDDGLYAGAGQSEQMLRVIERAENEHALLVDPIDRRTEGRGAGGNEQLVESSGAALRGMDGFVGQIDLVDAQSEARLDVVGAVPIDVVENDIVHFFFPGEDGRKQDAVVVDVGLVAEDGDLEIVIVL